MPQLNPYHRRRSCGVPGATPETQSSPGYVHACAPLKLAEPCPWLQTPTHAGRTVDSCTGVNHCGALRKHVTQGQVRETPAACQLETMTQDNFTVFIPGAWSLGRWVRD